MPRVTLSYRRDDSAGIARLIFERLRSRYGHDSVFMDIDAIELGEDYRERIHHALSNTDYLLVLIGPRWLGPLDAGPYRISEATDPVRMEVEKAFEVGLRIVPVLLEHTPMPDPEHLPESLRQLSYLNAADVTAGREFDSQIERIMGFIDRASAKQKPGAQPAAPRTLVPARDAVGKRAVVPVAVGVGAVVVAAAAFAGVHALWGGTRAASAPTPAVTATAAAHVVAVVRREAHAANAQAVHHAVAAQAAAAPPPAPIASQPARPTGAAAVPPRALALAPRPAATHGSQQRAHAPAYQRSVALAPAFLSAWAINARGKRLHWYQTVQARDAIDVQGCTVTIDQNGNPGVGGAAAREWPIRHVSFALSHLRLGGLNRIDDAPPFYETTLNDARSGAVYLLALPQQAGPSLYQRLTTAINACAGAQHVGGQTPATPYDAPNMIAPGG